MTFKKFLFCTEMSIKIFQATNFPIKKDKISYLLNEFTAPKPI